VLRGRVAELVDAVGSFESNLAAALEQLQAVAATQVWSVRTGAAGEGRWNGHICVVVSAFSLLLMGLAGYTQA